MPDLHCFHPNGKPRRSFTTYAAAYSEAITHECNYGGTMRPYACSVHGFHFGSEVGIRGHHPEFAPFRGKPDA
jgi:hypothetical protein